MKNDFGEEVITTLNTTSEKNDTVEKIDTSDIPNMHSHEVLRKLGSFDKDTKNLDIDVPRMTAYKELCATLKQDPSRLMVFPRHTLSRAIEDGAFGEGNVVDNSYGTDNIRINLPFISGEDGLTRISSYNVQTLLAGLWSINVRGAQKDWSMVGAEPTIEIPYLHRPHRGSDPSVSPLKMSLSDARALASLLEDVTFGKPKNFGTNSF